MKTQFLAGPPEKFEQALNALLAANPCAQSIGAVTLTGGQLAAVVEARSHSAAVSGSARDCRVLSGTPAKVGDGFAALQSANPYWRTLAVFADPKPPKEGVAAKQPAERLVVLAILLQP